jgi:SAM-dependent methyltransferase
VTDAHSTDARYDGLASEYEAFMDDQSPYYLAAADALRRLLGSGPGKCLDVGCGIGHFVPVATALDWTVTGIDVSEDQLRHARARLPGVELLKAAATALAFQDASFDAAYSTFTHTDFDDFAGAIAEVRRVLRRGGRFVYIGNHPCFVGAVQEHAGAGVPVLHAGYRGAGRRDAAASPGASPGGWRARLGSFVHLPLGPFLTAFSGLTLLEVEELDDGFEYPKTIAVSVERP